MSPAAMCSFATLTELSYASFVMFERSVTGPFGVGRVADKLRSSSASRN